MNFRILIGIIRGILYYISRVRIVIKRKLSIQKIEKGLIFENTKKDIYIILFNYHIIALIFARLDLKI